MPNGNRNQEARNDVKPQDKDGLEIINEVDENEEIEAPNPLGDVVNWADEREKVLTTVYGATTQQNPLNLRKAELEEIMIKPPADWETDADVLVTAVTMGATINPEHLKNVTSTSTIGRADPTDFRQTNLISDIPLGDRRFMNKSFADAMLTGRIDAAKAIAAYNQGDNEPVKEALGRLLGKAYDTQVNLNNISSKNNTMEYALLGLTEKLLNAELPFNVEELVPETQLVKIKAKINMCKIHADTVEARRQLLDNPGDPGSPEREALLSRIVVGYYTSVHSNAMNFTFMAQSDEILDEALRKNGVEIPPRNRIVGEGTEYDVLTKCAPYNLIAYTSRIQENLRNHTLTDVEYALSRPDAGKWFMDRAMEKLRRLPGYQDILQERDPKEMEAKLRKLLGRTKGINAADLLPDDAFAEFADEKQRLDKLFEEEYKQGMEKIEQHVEDTVAEFNETKALDELLARCRNGLNTRGAAKSPELARLQKAVTQFHAMFGQLDSQSLHSESVQRKLREVARLAAAYTESVRGKGEKTENWEPRSAADKAAYRAARSLQNDLAEYASPVPIPDAPKQEPDLSYNGSRFVTPAQRREIERSKQLFAQIPDTDTEKAIDVLLEREERYRAEHALEQEPLMASGVRTMMLLLAKQRFAPRVGETSAETVRRHRAMKEALSPDRVQDSLLHIYVDMKSGAYSPIEGVTVKDGYYAISGAFVDFEDGSSATTEDIRTHLEMNIARIEPYVDDGMEQVAFYEGNKEFERQFLGGDEPLTEQQTAAYDKVSQAMRALDNTLEPFYARNEQGELPVLTEEDFAKIRNGYQSVLNEMGTFISQASQSGVPIDMRRRELMERFQEKLGGDILALEAGKQLGLSTLPNILLSANLPTAEIAGKPEIVDAGANTRLRVNMLGTNGEPVEGFFTATGEVLKNLPLYIDELVDRETAGHPEWKDFIVQVLRLDEAKPEEQRLFSGQKALAAFDERASRSVDQFALFDNELRRFGDAYFHGVRGHNFSVAFHRILKEREKQRATLAAYNEQGLEKGNLDKRNIAMTTVADLLGMPTAVAPARAVKVKIDGQEVTGTFMKRAEGEDLANAQWGDPLTKITVEDMLTPESVASVADLQVLDYVCGNVDRHSRNMFYKLDTTDPNKPRCVGVQGIDNDFSFCMDAHGKSMADVLNMKIIRKETADALFSMKPEMIKTVLGGYDLSPQEIAAALKRVGELKQAVENKTIRVVTDDEIKTMNYATELATGDNYFKRLTQVPRNAKEIAFGADADEMKEAYGGLRDNGNAIGLGGALLLDANRGMFIGSEEFRNVIKCMGEVIVHRSMLLNGGDPQRIALYAEKLNRLRAAMRTYLAKKEREAERSKPSKLAEKRTNAVREASASIEREVACLMRFEHAVNHRVSILAGKTPEAHTMQSRRNANMEEERYLAKGAARELFPKLASRPNPTLARCGETLKAEADAVFAEAGKPDTPERLERKERLYAGLLANRMIERQMEKQGDAAQSLLRAVNTDPDLFEKMREMIRKSPEFNKSAAREIDRKLTLDAAQWDKTVSALEKSLLPKPAEPAKVANAPEKNNEPQAQNKGKKSGGPKA